MATYSSILAWRIPGTEEPCGLLSMGSHRDRGALWAAVYGVAQSRTQLKRLSSSSMYIYVCVCINKGVLLSRWQSRRTYTHLLLWELQNYNLLLNNHQQENVGSHQKDTPCPRQRRSPSKTVGGVKSHLESNSIPPRDTLKVKVVQSCLTLCDPMVYMVHGMLQVRILEWVAFPFSRGFQLWNRTQVSHVAGRFITSWATREAQEYWSG